MIITLAAWLGIPPAAWANSKNYPGILQTLVAGSLAGSIVGAGIALVAVLTELHDVLEIIVVLILGCWTAALLGGFAGGMSGLVVAYLAFAKGHR